MNRWNEICFLIKKHSKENSKEAFFQNEVVNIFEKLGWSRYKNEIETEKNVPIGATNKLRLDILIRLDEKKLFVVELKKPTNQGNERISQQLISYMLQLKMKFGLFIGENIQLFYDVPKDDKHPIKLIEIEFSENNEDGYKLIELLKRDTFDEQKLLEYCEEKLIEIEDNKTLNELTDFIISSQGNAYVLQLISKDLKEKYSLKIVDKIISQINIKTNVNRNEIENKFQTKEIPNSFDKNTTTIINRKSTMDTKEFKDWLINNNYKQNVVQSRLSNCNTVEKEYGNLDNHFKKDKGRELLELLSYSTDDERENRPTKHSIKIDGNLRTGSATLKLAVNLYMKFKMDIQENPNTM